MYWPHRIYYIPRSQVQLFAAVNIYILVHKSIFKSPEFCHSQLKTSMNPLISFITKVEVKQ